MTVENVPGARRQRRAATAWRRPRPTARRFYWGANGALTINPTLQAKPTYDVQRDLAPVARAPGDGEHPRGQQRRAGQELAELIALAKAQPGKLSYASPGVGTPQHIARRAAQEPGRRRHRPRALSRRGVHRRDRRARDHGAAEHGHDPAGGARRPAARARRHLAQALAGHARPADDRGIRVSRFRGDILVRAAGAGRHAGARSSPRCISRRRRSRRMPDMREKLAALGLDTAPTGRTRSPPSSRRTPPSGRR